MDNDTDTTGAPEAAEDTARSYRVREYRAEEFRAKVDKINKRLARVGIDGRFTFDEQPETVVHTEYDGREIEIRYVRFTLASPFTYSLGDYTFVASLVAEEAGYTTHCAPGQSLDGWARPALEDIHCDHCGKRRGRSKLHIVRENATGRLLQLGHDCIALYTGVSPKGLWLLEIEDDLEGLTGDDDSSPRARRDYSAKITDVLAFAWAHADQGRDYKSRAAAEWGVTSTGTHVRTSLFVPLDRLRNNRYPGGGPEYLYYRDKAAEAATYAADETLLADIRAAVETVDADSDYGMNLRTILAAPSGFVSDKNVGILASLVAVYARNKELAVKRAQAPKIAAGFLGDVKQRLRGLQLHLRTVRHSENDWGRTTFLVGLTPDNHLAMWSASAELDLEVGDTITLDATVKAHDEYKGDDQTVLTRGKILEVVSATGDYKPC